MALSSNRSSLVYLIHKHAQNYNSDTIKTQREREMEREGEGAGERDRDRETDRDLAGVCKGLRISALVGSSFACYREKTCSFSVQTS